MAAPKYWNVEIRIDEHEESRQTRAQARLMSDKGLDLNGAGAARRNPADREIPAIGDELAAARALFDLAHHLLESAARDIESATDEVALVLVDQSLGSEVAQDLLRRCAEVGRRVVLLGRRFGEPLDGAEMLGFERVELDLVAPEAGAASLRRVFEAEFWAAEAERFAAQRRTLLDGCPVRPLGYNGDCYFVSDTAGQIRALRPRDLQSPSVVLSLFHGDDTWLRKECPTESLRAKTGQSRVAWHNSSAEGRIMRACVRQGFFDPAKHVRVPGVWPFSADLMVGEEFAGADQLTRPYFLDDERLVVGAQNGSIFEVGSS